MIDSTFAGSEADQADAESVTREELAERTRQLRVWLESEARVLVVDDVPESERERMFERAETARYLETMLDSV